MNACRYPTLLRSTLPSMLLPILLLPMLLLSATVGAQQKLPVTSLTIGMHLVKAEVAINDEERATGLMLRREMGPNEGMVFRFPSPRPVCMWMKNTLLPLSVAFIDEDGKIINIEDMQPQTENAHCAKRAARYALEMNQGWFRKKNIKPGTPVDGLPR